MLTSPPNPFFSVYPPSYNASSVGEVFNISVVVNSLDPNWYAVGFEFTLHYDDTILELLQIWEGPMLPPFASVPVQGTLFMSHAGAGSIQVGDCVLPHANGVWYLPMPSGGGVLATLEFNATRQDVFPQPNLTCALQLTDTKISNTIAQAVPQSAPVNGLYTIASSPPCLASFTAFKNVVGKDYAIPVNVTINNVGNNPENVTLTFYANATPLDSEMVLNLLNGTSVNLTCLGNTSSCGYGNYTLSLYCVPNGTDEAAYNFTYTGIVEVTIPGDVNGDGTVNVLDAIIVSNAFLATPNSSNWNSNADINNDNSVNILDAIILSNNFNQNFTQTALGIDSSSTAELTHTLLDNVDRPRKIANSSLSSTSTFSVSGKTIIASGLPGDLNHDGTVDILDALIAGAAFGTRSGGSGWNPEADMNGDGQIDIFDIVMIAMNFGMHT
jgi:hypothetical protein